jgi:predicted ribosome quality control (RQC) complex YloA/Tae2 family protein
MLNQIYTIEKISAEMQELIGFKLIDVISQEKDSAVLTFFDNESFRFIKFYGVPQFEAIFLTDKFNRKNSNYSTLFLQLKNEVIQDVFLIPFTRVICFVFINYKIYFQLFGNGQNNIIVTNLEDMIVDSLDNSSILIGIKYTIQPANLFDLNELPTNLTIQKALSYSTLLLNQFYTIEFLNQTGIDLKKKVGEFDKNEISKIIDAAKQYVNLIKQSQKCYIILNENQEKIFSLLPLESIGKIEQISEKASILISKVLSYRFQQRKYNDLFKRTMKLALDEFKKFRKKQIAFENEKMKLELAEKYREYADLLYSLPNNLKERGQKEINVLDFDGIKRTIELNPKLSLIENAEKYYEKSKNLIKSVNVINSIKEQIQEQYIVAENRLKELELCVNLTQLKEHLKKYSDFYQVKMAKEEKEISERFKKFQLSETAFLYVGKDAKNNDELTFGFGKANDYWFHIRGASGSHCILKYTAQGTPPKQILEKAASIAAYYSSQRNGKYVPVVYTQKKYVRKPKGANPGAVIISKEEVIMVEPKLFEN